MLLQRVFGIERRFEPARPLVNIGTLSLTSFLDARQRAAGNLVGMYVLCNRDPKCRKARPLLARLLNS